MLDLPRPALAGGERKAIESDMNPAQQAAMDTYGREPQPIPQNPRKALPDNMAALYGDAAKLALDLRLYNPGAADDPQGRPEQGRGQNL